MVHWKLPICWSFRTNYPDYMDKTIAINGINKCESRLNDCNFPSNVVFHHLWQMANLTDWFKWMRDWWRHWVIWQETNKCQSNNNCQYGNNQWSQWLKSSIYISLQLIALVSPWKLVSHLPPAGIWTTWNVSSDVNQRTSALLFFHWNHAMSAMESAQEM